MGHLVGDDPGPDISSVSSTATPATQPAGGGDLTDEGLEVWLVRMDPTLPREISSALNHVSFGQSQSREIFRRRESLVKFSPEKYWRVFQGTSPPVRLESSWGARLACIIIDEAKQICTGPHPWYALGSRLQKE
jgi:hypothetical protein